MGYITWIVFGVIAGASAKFIMPQIFPAGAPVTILLGILGAMIGGLVSFLLGFGDVASFDIKSFVFAVAGSVLLLYGLTFVKKA